jgi:hypothetical protein
VQAEREPTIPIGVALDLLCLAMARERTGARWIVLPAPPAPAQ